MLHGVFWQDQRATSWLEMLHFWSKTMPSLANIHLLRNNSWLAPWHWQRLTTWPWTMMQLFSPRELPCYQVHLPVKLSTPNSTPSFSGDGKVVWAQAGPENTRMLPKGWLTLTGCSILADTYALTGIPYSQCMEEKSILSLANKWLCVLCWWSVMPCDYSPV